MTKFKHTIMPGPTRSRIPQEDNSWLFSSNIEDWHPEPKRTPPSLKKGLEAVKMKGLNTFRAANDNLIIWR